MVIGLRHLMTVFCNALNGVVTERGMLNKCIKRCPRGQQRSKRVKKDHEE